MARRPQSAFSFDTPRLLPGVRALLIALAVTSIGVAAVGGWGSDGLGATLQGLLRLRPHDLWRGHLWELASYTFLELSVLGLLLCGLMLWTFGTALEQAWGTRRFLGFYFSTTALAGVAAALLGLVLPSVGASVAQGSWAAIEALAAGFALTFPTAQIRLAFILPIQARLLIPISLGLTLVSILMTGEVVPYVVPVLALLAAVALHDLPTPRGLLLRLRVLWIERRMRRRNLRVVPKLPGDDELPAPRSGSRGSDGFLH